MTDIEKVIDAIECTYLELRQWANCEAEYKVVDGLEKLANKLKEYVTHD